MSRISGYFRLMRPVNCLMIGFAVIVGAALVNPTHLSAFWLNLAYGFVTGFTLSAASMAINDYYDREIDAVNEPKRPIPSGLVKPQEAMIFAMTLTAIGFSAAYFTSLYCLITAVIAWIIFVTYTTIGKRSGLPGNFLVSTCVAIPLIYGSVAIAGEVALNILIFACMAFLSNTGREITKGIVDAEGDRTQNVKTLAVRYGNKMAAAVASFFYVSAVLLSPAPVLLNLVSFGFIPLVLVFDIGLVLSSLLLLRDYSRENARRVKKALLLWFIVGLLAFVVGALG